MFKLIFYDLILSIVITLIITGFIQHFYNYDVINNSILSHKEDIYPLIATISGTLLGFVITRISIILAFPESGKLKLLKKSSHYNEIFKTYLSTTKYLAINTIISIIGIILNGQYAVIISFILVLSIIISTFRIGRCLWILENIVELSKKEPKKSQTNN